MIEIFGTPASRTRRCLWTAEECQAEYELKSIKPAAGDARDEAYLALNPNARVPTLRDGDLVLFESAAICVYIAERHPEAGLLFERGTHEAALHNQWLFWIVTELEQALWSMGKHRFALPQEHRIEAMLETAQFEFKRAAKVLASAVAGRDFLVGDHFSVADILAAQTLNWARNFKVDFGSDELERYLDLHLARPAFLATQALE